MRRNFRANARSAAQLDRARGVLVGQMVGDALGTTVEFSDPVAIAGKFPGGHREIVGAGPFSVLPGQVTDDTELALALARCLARDGLDLDARARAYAAWYQSGPFDVGAATSAAFGGWGSDVTAKAMFARSVERNGAAGKQANGALMRVSPLAIFGADFDTEALVQRAREDARFSHPSAVCQAASGAFVAAIQVGLRGGSRKEGHDAALAAADEPAVAEALRDVATQPKCHGQGQGWVLVALRNAFHLLLKETSFEDALVRTVMAGGDADTNGCIAGALLGAFHGLEGIPPRWVVKVLSCRTSRGASYQTTDAITLADDLLERGGSAATTEVSAKVHSVAATTSLAEAVRVAEAAGGRVAAHHSQPDERAVIKVPLSQTAAMERLQALVGATPIRGQKYWVFDVQKPTMVSAPPRRNSAPQAPPGARTSVTHPIRVDWLGLQTTPGKVGLTFAPGKRSHSKYSGGQWHRDLDTDLDALVQKWGAAVLVCLLEDADLKRLGIESLVEQAAARGLEVIRFPIRDVSIPAASVAGLVKQMRDRAEAGKNVVVHCEGGLGRAGTIGGCYLAQFGHGPEEILRSLVSSRGPNCPETDQQRQFIRDFQANGSSS